MEDMDNEIDWRIKFRKFILDELKDGLTYSLAVQGYSKIADTIWTYGEHMLVTNKINIDQCIIYIEGKIDASILDQYSDYIAPKDLVVKFKYRVVSFY
jgi:hypothetical protein